MLPKLPYEFDLLYDVKSYTDVENIAYGRPSRCDVTPQELVDLFRQHEIPLPYCLQEK